MTIYIDKGKSFINNLYIYMIYISCFSVLFSSIYNDVDDDDVDEYKYVYRNLYTFTDDVDDDNDK